MLSGEICALCGKNQATLFFQYFTIEGERRNLGICQECVEAQGIDADSVDGILELFEFEGEDGGPPPVVDLGEIPAECPQCGRSVIALLNSGRVGCERCYVEYRTLIEDGLRNLKRQLQESEDEERGDRTSELRQMLAEAVADERFEDAAKLRDALEEAEADE